jgi:hypothetical protein
MATYAAILMDPLLATSKHLLPLPQRRMCRVYCRLTDGSGQPIEDAVIAFAPTHALPIVGRAGHAGTPIEMQTDDHGEASVYLLRGVDFRVSIYNTPYIRTITVPARAEQDLFYLLSDAPDLFSIQIADVITAPRSTL